MATPTSIISKKIQKTDTEQSNGSYAHALFQYMTNPEGSPSPDLDPDQPRGEKCVHWEAQGFSRPDLDVKQMAREIRTHARTIEDGDTMSLVSHWVISWKGDDMPTQAQAVGAAKDLLADMGYGPDHPAVIGVHMDTDNLHVHVAAYRASVATDQIIREGDGWWKLEGQRFNARAADKYGWTQESGARFVATGETETVKMVNGFTGEETERTRAVVKAAPKTDGDQADKPKALRDRAMWSELKTGVRSHQGYLQDKLAELEPMVTDKMKFGEVHKLLADHGIEMELREHGMRQGLTYTADGEHWEKAGSIDPQHWSLDALESKLGKKYRHARASVHEIAEAARKEMNTMPTIEAEAKTPLSRDQVAALRGIPADDVRERFGIEATDSRKVRNGLDVLIYESKKPYDQAVKELAAAYPGVVSGEDLIRSVPEESYQARLKLFGVPDSLKTIARDTMKQVDAWGCERFHVYASGDEIGYTSRKKYPDGMTQADLFKELPNLARLNTDKNAAIFFAPVHKENRISIPVDDVNPLLLKRHRPSLVFATSDRSSQAHYVVERKYSTEFYDWFTKRLNEKYGDPKIKAANHDTRLAGFTNRKQYRTDGVDLYPQAKIKEHTPLRCATFEKYIDDEYQVYQREVQQQAALPTGKDTVNRAAQIHADEQRKAAVAAKVKDAAKSIDNSEMAEARARLEIVHVPGEMAAAAAQFQAITRAKYGDNLDRSRADWMLAQYMMDNGATVDQVYSYLRKHSMQDDQRVSRTHKDGTAYEVVKHPNQASRDKYAGNTAIRYARTVTPAKPLESSPDALADVIASKREQDTLTPWQRREASTAIVPVPVDSTARDKEVAQADTHQAELAAEAAAKAKAEAEAKAAELERQRQEEAARKAAEAEEKRKAREAWLKTPEGKEWQRAQHERSHHIPTYTPPSGGHNSGHNNSGPRM